MLLLLRQSWLDPRLAGIAGVSTELLHGSFADLMWIPDLYVSNAKSAEQRHDVTSPNVFLWLESDGTVTHNHRSEPLSVFVFAGGSLVRSQVTSVRTGRCFSKMLLIRFLSCGRAMPNTLVR